MATVLISDSLHPICEELLHAAGFETRTVLKATPEELAGHAAGVDGWIIRSGTQVTAELLAAADSLQVVGRAGVGVDNVDLPAATKRGVLVINAPAGNTISTAEHTVAMLLALARHIGPASASLRAGKWDKKSFTGAEVFEKTLGVVGVGKIGRTVAERMHSFGMRILGYDPVLAPDVAERIGIELVDLDRIYAESDFITVHTPLNDDTRGLLGSETLPMCKRGVLIVNCARGGIVDEAALLAALESGQVGGAALDVFSHEPPPASLRPLLEHPRVLATPHIAASTDEAQEKVARQVTEQVIRALKGEPVSTAVNAMAIRMAGQREVQPFMKLADRLASIARQLTSGRIRGLVVRCHGDVPRRYADVLLVAALRGLLTGLHEDGVNLVNAPTIAGELGLRANVETFHAEGSYSNLLEIVVESDEGDRHVIGTVFGAEDIRIVRIDDFWVEIRPTGPLLFYRNVDRPGMLAHVGGLLAEARVNIAGLALGRQERGQTALTAITLDENVPEETLEAIRRIDGVEGVRAVNA